MDSEDENTPPDDLRPRSSQKPTPAPFYHAPFKPSVPEVSLLFNNAPQNVPTSNIATTFRNNTKSSENHSADEFESYNAWKYKNLNSSHKSNLSPEEISPTFKYYSPPPPFNPANNRLSEQMSGNVPIRNSPEGGAVQGQYHRNDSTRDDFHHEQSPYMAPLLPHGYRNPQNTFPGDTYASPTRQRLPNNSPLPEHTFPQRNYESMSSQHQMSNDLLQGQRFTSNDLMLSQRQMANDMQGQRYTSNDLLPSQQRQMSNELPSQRFTPNDLLANQRFTPNELMSGQRQFFPNDLMQNQRFTANDLLPRNSGNYAQRVSVNDYDSDRRYNQFEPPIIYSAVNNTTGMRLSHGGMNPEYRQGYDHVNPRDEMQREEIRHVNHIANQTSPQRGSRSNIPQAYENLMRNQPNSYQNHPGDSNRITNFISSSSDPRDSAHEMMSLDDRFQRANLGIDVRDKPENYHPRKSPNGSRNRKTTANAVSDLCRIVQLQNEQLQILQTQVAQLLNHQLKMDNRDGNPCLGDHSIEGARRISRGTRGQVNANVNQLSEAASSKNARAANPNPNELPTRDRSDDSLAWDKSMNFSTVDSASTTEQHPNNYAVVQKVSIGVMTSFDVRNEFNDRGARPKNKAQRSTQTSEACYNDLRRNEAMEEAARANDEAASDPLPLREAEKNQSSNYYRNRASPNQINDLHPTGHRNEAKSTVNAMRHCAAAAKSNLGNPRQANRFMDTPANLVEDIPRLPTSESVDESVSLHASDMPAPTEHVPTPNATMNIDMPDYRSSDEEQPDSPVERGADDGRVGWTFYNNVVGQVNQILQSSPSRPTESSESSNPAEEFRFPGAPARNCADEAHARTWKDNVEVGHFGAQCGGKDATRLATVEQLRRLGVTICDQQADNNAVAPKKMTFDSLYYNYPRLDFMRLNNAEAGHEPNDVSHGMNALAMKYLKDDQINEYARLSTAAGNNMQDVTVYNIATKTTNLSFATMRYLERYQLLPPRTEQLQQLPQVTEPTNLARQEQRPPIREESNQASQPASVDANDQRGANQRQEQRPPTKILDITALKQQPKFI